MGRKFGENLSCCNALEAHHDEIEMKFLMHLIVSWFVSVFSGARPGCTTTSVSSYIQRLKIILEDICLRVCGDSKAYAIQAVEN